MTQTPLLENWASGAFLVRESPGTMSRDTVTFDNTAGALDLLVQGGTVFSYAAPGTPTVAPKPGNTGNGTISPVQTTQDTMQTGAYVVTFTGPTTYSVTAPDGSVLNPGTVGQSYLDGIGFLVSASGTAFVAGDAFTVTVPLGSLPTVAPKIGGNTGTGTLTGIELAQAATAMLGNYILTFSNANNFTLLAPDGRTLQAGVVGQDYNDELGFLVTAGGTNFASGDQFVIGIGTGTGLVTAYTGARPAAGIIFNQAYVPAGNTKALAAIVRNAEVNQAELQYAAGVSVASQMTALAQLRLQGIIPRMAV